MQVRDLTGQRFGRLTVQERAPGTPKAKWWCLCECGKTIDAYGSNLIRGNTTSCGCSRSRHGLAGTRVYSVWRQMRQRCENPNDPSYGDYGGRGIKVCQRWQAFDLFHADMGFPPHGGTLERIDNERGYEPGNCRWATRREQSLNKRSNRIVTAFGRAQTLQQWAEEFRLPLTTLRNRLDRAKMPAEAALTARAKRKP